MKVKLHQLRVLPFLLQMKLEEAQNTAKQNLRSNSTRKCTYYQKHTHRGGETLMHSPSI